MNHPLITFGSNHVPSMVGLPMLGVGDPFLPSRLQSLQPLHENFPEFPSFGPFQTFPGPRTKISLPIRIISIRIQNHPNPTLDTQILLYHKKIWNLLNFNIYHLRCNNLTVKQFHTATSKSESQFFNTTEKFFFRLNKATDASLIHCPLYRNFIVPTVNAESTWDRYSATVWQGQLGPVWNVLRLSSEALSCSLHGCSCATNGFVMVDCAPHWNLHVVALSQHFVPSELGTTLRSKNETNAFRCSYRLVYYFNRFCCIATSCGKLCVRERGEKSCHELWNCYVALFFPLL